MKRTQKDGIDNYEKSTERWDRQLNNIVMEAMVDIRLRDNLDKTDAVKKKSVIN